MTLPANTPPADAWSRRRLCYSGRLEPLREGHTRKICRLLTALLIGATVILATTVCALKWDYERTTDVDDFQERWGLPVAWARDDYQGYILARRLLLLDVWIAVTFDAPVDLVVRLLSGRPDWNTANERATIKLHDLARAHHDRRHWEGDRELEWIFRTDRFHFPRTRTRTCPWPRRRPS
jgi:hypothetical protein